MPSKIAQLEDYLKLEHETVDRQEAAEILGTSVLEAGLREGLIQVDKEGKLNAEDVSLLRSVLETPKKLSEIRETATAAAFQSRRTERIVSKLLFFMELDIPMQPIDKASIERLHLRIAHDEAAAHPLNEAEIVNWARTFQGLAEEHFEALAKRVDEDACFLLLRLAKKLRAQLDTTGSNELQVHYFERAVRNLQSSAYLYIQGKYGARKAKAQMRPYTTDFYETDEHVLNLIHTFNPDPSQAG